jgi:hypothetical protein
VEFESGADCGRFTVEGAQEEVRSVQADDPRLDPRSVPSVATFVEVAEKLSKLREHLDQVVAALNAPTEEWTHEQGDVALGGRFRRARNPGNRLRCHECGRIGTKEEPGWTLRLCGDDELHACCSDCDTYLSGNGA